jgi:MoaA/NifB/PqqE/SkfB family radical SAM enzyme
MNYLDIQISMDGVDRATNDAVRGEGSFDTSIAAMNFLRDANFGPFKISVVMTRHNVDQLDAFKQLADSYGAQLRITRPLVAVQTRGMSCTQPKRNSARSMTGLLHTATTCSLAIRSST